MEAAALTPQREPLPAKKLLSIVFSFRNEEEVIDELLLRLHGALENIDMDYEFVFVNDASTDASASILEKHMENDPHVRLVNMANRFGVVPCMIAGLKYARGDAVALMDCDLQDPPEAIPRMLERWRDGADVVYGTRTVRRGESPVKLFLTKCAYRVINALSEIDLPVDSGMFKLLDRRVVESLLEVDEQDPYLRGLITWVGFRQDQVLYEREERYAGKTHFPLFSQNPVREFAVAIISFSKIPLSAIVALGLFITVSALIALVGLGVAALFGAEMSLMAPAFVSVVLLSGVQLFATGIIALYIGRIYKQTRNRPHFIVESAHGFPDDQAPPSA